jgi:hypothetical protein
MSAEQAQPRGWWRRLALAASAFVSAPASARPLAYLRIGTAAVLLVQAFWITDSLLALYGRGGVVDWRLNESTATPNVPRLSWFSKTLAPYGVSHDASVRVVFLAYLASLTCLLLGWRTRPAAVVAWLTHLSMKVSGNLSTYGMDTFANIVLFYLMWMPVGNCLSLDRRAGRYSGAPSATARLALRVLQLHLCLIYFSSGIAKANFPELLRWLRAAYPDRLGWLPVAADTGAAPPDAPPDWWTGRAIWDAFMLPSTAQFDFRWMAWHPWVPMLLGWGTLLIELGYPLFIWPRRTRQVGALATIGMHLGIGLALGLWMFSAVMIVMNWSGFLVSPEPRPEELRLKDEG